MMLEKTLDEFIKDAATLVNKAILNDDFVTVTTDVGKAVVINQAEWDMLIDATRHALTSI